MDRTSRAPGPTPGSTNASPCEDFSPIASDEYPFVCPADSLRTSAPQLARFLLMVMQADVLGDVRILSEASVAEMLRIQYPGPAPDLRPQTAAILKSGLTEERLARTIGSRKPLVGDDMAGDLTPRLLASHSEAAHRDPRG